LEVDLETESARYQLRETIAAISRPWFTARNLVEVTSELDAARVLWGPYRTLHELAQENARDRDGALLRHIHQPDIGWVPATGSPLRWADGTPGPVPAPLLGADTADVLSTVLGLSGCELGLWTMKE